MLALPQKLAHTRDAVPRLARDQRQAAPPHGPRRPTAVPRFTRRRRIAPNHATPRRRHLMEIFQAGSRPPGFAPRFRLLTAGATYCIV